MTALNASYTPGLAAASVDAFTQANPACLKPPLLPFGFGKSSMDLPVNSLIGRITGTNLLVLSVQTATDGSQNPVGITSLGVVNSDSNSGLVDSNSEAGADLNDVSYAKDGEWNYDVINKDASWTLALLRAALDRTPLQVAQIKTASPSTPSEP